MPYTRVGSVKYSDHWLRSPLTNVSAACQTCHNVDEDELVSRVVAIQTTTVGLVDDTEVAILAAMDDPVSEFARQQTSADAAEEIDDARGDARLREREPMDAAEEGRQERADGVHVEVQKST